MLVVTCCPVQGATPPGAQARPPRRPPPAGYDHTTTGCCYPFRITRPSVVRSPLVPASEMGMEQAMLYPPLFALLAPHALPPFLSTPPSISMHCPRLSTGWAQPLHQRSTRVSLYAHVFVENTSRLFSINSEHASS